MHLEALLWDVIAADSIVIPISLFHFIICVNKQHLATSIHECKRHANFARVNGFKFNIVNLQV